MKKGVILAGGMGTRLRPLTYLQNKHLLPVYDRPMIEYPINTLKKLGVTDILIVSGGDHIGSFAEYLGSGSKYGVTFTYKVQDEAGGIAQALGLAKDFFGEETVHVILGDNIFDPDYIIAPDNLFNDEATVYVTENVEDMKRFGVIFDDGAGKKWIIEKPSDVSSNNPKVITGLYIYPNDVFDFIQTLSPSARGELEISDVNAHYLAQNKLITMELGGYWSDAGKFESLFSATAWARSKDTNHLTSN